MASGFHTRDLNSRTSHCSLLPAAMDCLSAWMDSCCLKGEEDDFKVIHYYSRFEIWAYLPVNMINNQALWRRVHTSGNVCFVILKLVDDLVLAKSENSRDLHMQ